MVKSTHSTLFIPLVGFRTRSALRYRRTFQATPCCSQLSSTSICPLYASQPEASPDRLLVLSRRMRWSLRNLMRLYPAKWRLALLWAVDAWRCLPIRNWQAWHARVACESLQALWRLTQDRVQSLAMSKSLVPTASEAVKLLPSHSRHLIPVPA